MATATVSKRNAKLPTVSNIAFCTAAGKDMSKVLYTGSNGKFTRKVGFKQSSTAYPYQIQYRQHSRYTVANAKVKGATWTNWSPWKNAIGVTGIPVDAYEFQKPIAGWMKANKGVNKNSTYLTFYSFDSYVIPNLYDARQFQFRIRTFNKSQAKHGDFRASVLSVYKRAEVVDSTLITASDGGLKIKYNYLWDRTASIAVNSIKDSEGRELLKKAYTTGIQLTTLNENTTPTPRQGYKAGVVNIDIDKLKRRVLKNEQLTLDIRFVTVDGAPTMFPSGTVIEPTRDINVNLSYTWDQVLGLLKVQAANNDSVALANIGCNVSYSYNGKAYSLAAFNVTKNLTGTSTFYYYPPIGIPVNIYVKEEDANDYKDNQSITGLTLNASGYRLNKVNSTSICGLAWGEPSYSVNGQPQYQTSLPYGRQSNVIFYGQGTTKSITLSATIVDKENCYGGSYARKLAWQNVQNNQGLYIFRTNKGELFKVGLTGVDMKHNVKDLYDLQVNMVEVV